jgi:hypothetical protein
MTRLKYETTAGNLSEGDTYSQLIEHLRLAQEAAYMLGHFRTANDDRITGTAFQKIGDILGKACDNVTAVATSRTRN